MTRKSEAKNEELAFLNGRRMGFGVSTPYSASNMYIYIFILYYIILYYIILYYIITMTLGSTATSL